MKNIQYHIYIIASIIIVGLSSCEKVLLESKPDSDDLSIFNEYATLVTEKYAMLEFKGVDIEQLTDSLRSTITGDISDEELFEKMSTITKRLRDGHSDLFIDANDTTASFYAFDIYAGYPIAFDVENFFVNYLATDINPHTAVTQSSEEFLFVGSRLGENKNIGYVWIPSWDVDIPEEKIDSLFLELKDTKGLIIDLRGNTGGDPALATRFASYLTDSSVDTGFERFKTGPGANDFSDSKVIMEPADSEYRYTKPTVVLQDRGVYSASTTFLYSVDPIESVKTIGQISGGGSGSVADGYLANGWKWSLSTSEFIDAKGRHLDDGVEADIPVDLDPMNPMVDELIERALLELE